MATFDFDIWEDELGNSPTTRVNEIISNLKIDAKLLLKQKDDPCVYGEVWTFTGEPHQLKIAMARYFNVPTDSEELRTQLEACDIDPDKMEMIPFPGETND